VSVCGYKGWGMFSVSDGRRIFGMKGSSCDTEWIDNNRVIHIHDKLIVSDISSGIHTGVSVISEACSYIPDHILTLTNNTLTSLHIDTFSEPTTTLTPGSSSSVFYDLYDGVQNSSGSFIDSSEVVCLFGSTHPTDTPSDCKSESIPKKAPATPADDNNNADQLPTRSPTPLPQTALPPTSPEPQDLPDFIPITGTFPKYESTCRSLGAPK